MNRALEPSVTMTRLREALEASWRPDTAYLGVEAKGNRALGQCYPTSRVIQHYYPRFEIAQGEVWTGKKLETHFWNVLVTDEGLLVHVDLTWQQFPHGSQVRSFRIRDRNDLGDSSSTLERVERLLGRVKAFLGEHSHDEKNDGYSAAS